MKHITFFIASLSSGGAEHQLVTLAKFLCEEGYLVTIVNYADTLDHYQVPKGVEQIKLGRGVSRFLKFLSIVRYFLSVKTDVVISFGQRDNFLCLIPLLIRRNIKVIAGERNFTVGKSDFYEKWLLKLLYKRANYIVPNSHSQREYLISKKAKWKDKIKTITNYTDLSLYVAKSGEEVNSDRLTIAIFSRFVPQKNCLVFADVVRKIKEDIGDKIIFSWYGNMEPKGNLNTNYLRVLKRTINEYGIQNMFLLHNHVQDVAHVMSMYNAICLPSLREGFSNTISEAICLGKPVLASDISDNKYMIHNGKNGFLFNPTDVDDMVSTIEKFYFLSNKEKQQMGLNSRCIAESLFNKEDFINNYICIIEN